jgi:hypothetical protein
MAKISYLFEAPDHAIYRTAMLAQVDWVLQEKAKIIPNSRSTNAPSLDHLYQKCLPSRSQIILQRLRSPPR